MFEEQNDEKVGYLDRRNSHHSESEDLDWNAELLGSDGEDGSECSFVTYHLSQITTEQKKIESKYSLLNALLDRSSQDPPIQSTTTPQLPSFKKHFFDVESMLAAYKEPDDHSDAARWLQFVEDDRCCQEFLDGLQWSRTLCYCTLYPEIGYSPVFLADLSEHRLTPMYTRVQDLHGHLLAGGEEEIGRAHV